MTGYLFKDTVSSYITRTTPDLRVAQRAIGHVNQRNTRIYTKDALLGANLDSIEQLAVPGLHTRFGSRNDEDLWDFYRQLSHSRIHYLKYKENWLEELMPLLYGNSHQQRFLNDNTVDFTATGDRREGLVRGLRDIHEENEEQSIQEERREVLPERPDRSEEDIVSKSEVSPGDWE